jgi:hypothetical protein
MPTDDRLRLEDFERVQHFGGEPIKPYKRKAIDVAEGYSFGRSPPQHIKLMSQDENFGLQHGLRPKETDHSPPYQPAEIGHHGDYQRFAPDRQPIWVCGRDNGTAHA